jgi:hypothetical protein
MSMTAIEKNGRIKFAYRCECCDCDEAGTMVLQTHERGTVVCPGGCGAAYYPWKRPDGKWELKNVIMPVYGDPERGDYVE